jgi:NCAIR mutase (PurE)-related protein
MAPVDDSTLRQLLDDLVAGRTSADEVVARLSRLPFAEVDGASVDHHRALRQGMPEAVYGPGKTPEQCAGIVGELLANGHGPVLLTRADADQVKTVTAAHPDGVLDGGVVVWRPWRPTRNERVIIAVAGTADLPVADECSAVLRAYGFSPTVIRDVGVTGLHRLVPHLDEVADAAVVVAIAGMEGALASVIGGLTAAPIVAVPTSTGYGAGLEGVTALLAMLASCASGVTVVGIDNGFGAACAVARVLRVGGR